MNKVYVLPPDEDWIVDRFVKEWNEDNSDISVLDPYQADVIWLLADWCWRKIPTYLLKNKKVITTVHHIVPEKFGPKEKQEFKIRDEYTDVYHVYNQLTENFIKPLTIKPIKLIPYWANQKIWKITGTKEQFRKKYNIPLETHVIGSFQRDTEGAGIDKGIFLPKLEKGPDLFIDYVKYVKTKITNIHVLLSGWRRQYVIKELLNNSINYTYIERPDQFTINELYQCLDLYPVTSRCEGGPQALIECGLLNVPTVSREIGIATQVLSIKSINNNLKITIPTIPIVNDMQLPEGYASYIKIIQQLK